MSIIPVFEKSPTAEISIPLDWTKYLNGATISSVAATVPSGLTTISGASANPTQTTIKLGGGTLYQTYRVKFQVTLSDGEKPVQSVDVKIVDQ